MASAAPTFSDYRENKTVAPFTDADISIFRVLLSVIVFIGLYKTRAKGFYFKKFLTNWLKGFAVEGLILIVNAYIVTHTATETPFYIWRFYEIVRAFLLLLLCYPMHLLLSHNSKNLGRELFVMSAVIIGDAVLDYLYYHGEHFGLNSLAFFVIFLYLQRKFTTLKAFVEGDFPNLTIIIHLLQILIIAYGIEIFAFYAGFLSIFNSLRLVGTVFQYLIFYLSITTMANITIHTPNSV